MLGTKWLCNSEVKGLKLCSLEFRDEQGSEHKIALLMQCVEPGADVLHSFHFHNQQWNAQELPLNSNSIKA
jgi:hypothetical protein